ncbi:MAG TPA: hypothetical protein VF952_20630 [Chloroflexia bacterium]|jgi:hypothetical protein
MQNLSGTDRTTLLEYFTSHYDMEQVETLVYELNINSELLKKPNLTVFCRELLQYCERNDKVGCLLLGAIKEKPDPAVEAICQRAPTCTPEVKLAVIIRDAGMKDLRRALLAFLEAQGLKPGEVSVIGAAAGSLRILIAVPEDVAQRILANPVRELAQGRYHVESIRRYSRLSPEEQLRWRAEARTGPAVTIKKLANGQTAVTVLGGGSTMSGLLTGILLFLLVLLAGAGATYVLAPRLELQNKCGYAIPLPSELPIIGSSIGEGASSYLIWPGDYTVSEKLTYNGLHNIRVMGPVGLDTGETSVQEPFTVSKDGVPIAFNQPINVGVGSDIALVFCTSGADDR